MSRFLTNTRRRAIILLWAYLWGNFRTAHAVQEEDEVDFPPLLDSSDIAYFFERHDLEGLHYFLQNVFQRSARNPQNNPDRPPLPELLVSRGGGSTYTTAYKLQLDLEQAEYLAETLQDTRKADFFRTTVAPLYRKILSHIPPLEDLQRTHGLYAFRPIDYELQIADIYNKAWHLTDFDTLLQDEDTPLTTILNPHLDAEQIQRQWFGEEQDGDPSVPSTPGVVVVDDILSPPALARIRLLLLESTVWYQTKMPETFGGYVGAYIDDGLYDRILLELAHQLSERLPRIFQGHPLKYMWAYKYDSNFEGIHTHADEAAVNVNLWITPDEANLDPSSGGLVIFTAKPPDDMDFSQYNTDTAFVEEHLLKPTNFANVTVPYRQNRAVLFDSALFHHTDKFRFKEGYKNRRINLTLLYGDMQKGGQSSTASSSTSTQDEL